MNDSQLTLWGLQGMVLAEQGEQLEASSTQRIAPDKSANVYSSGDLLERIVDKDNMRHAYRKVKANKGAAGIDKMGVSEMYDYFKEHSDELIKQIKRGKYAPSPVLRVEIPKKEKGKVRKLGIPTVVDRVVQQAIVTQLTPLFEPTFSDSSYGFRPNRSAHDALYACKRHIDEGYGWVVDMDLEKFFDTVCQSKLIQIVSETITDGRVVSLIHKYLHAGVMVEGKLEETKVGMPQGGPLSPLLSNIILNELDQELERRGHKFVRYADDCMIFCKSKRAAKRTAKSIIRFIEGKLFLKVNHEKTSVAYFNQVKYLGYAFYRHKGVCRFRVHPKSIKAMKGRIRELTARSNAMSNEYRPKAVTWFVRGWVNYFKLADMKKLLKDIDCWMRRRIRMVYWKQWKRVRTRFKMLQKCGIEKGKAWEFANTRKAYWHIAASPIMNVAIKTEQLRRKGYLFFSDYYEQVHVC
ncbi:group II intron reverse transcriptase/maturase [Adlercreutzia sp. ZJ141]|uniref:group II intron reverse transcriptase/maturase n=1 Tax=Adlercreutzia sp. ZJ141 TaxID=2709406 RepID=UPI0013EC8232|nr:group II intron reverse transcriptase/maturase [Adlercreutzia sp. ZJ141]